MHPRRTPATHPPLSCTGSGAQQTDCCLLIILVLQQLLVPAGILLSQATPQQRERCDAEEGPVGKVEDDGEEGHAHGDAVEEPRHAAHRTRVLAVVAANGAAHVAGRAGAAAASTAAAAAADALTVRHDLGGELACLGQHRVLLQRVGVHQHCGLGAERRVLRRQRQQLCVEGQQGDHDDGTRHQHALRRGGTPLDADHAEAQHAHAQGEHAVEGGDEEEAHQAGKHGVVQRKLGRQPHQCLVHWVEVGRLGHHEAALHATHGVQRLVHGGQCERGEHCQRHAQQQDAQQHTEGGQKGQTPGHAAHTDGGKAVISEREDALLFLQPCQLDEIPPSRPWLGLQLPHPLPHFGQVLLKLHARLT
mmetsp:Transcript_1343/g.3956  ORF Transcript_1343/g.3956 Transcript_1343/m.3956 type:complete len:362 (-) Transcript_1343:60-1145(-)